MDRRGPRGRLGASAHRREQPRAIEVASILDFGHRAGLHDRNEIGQCEDFVQIVGDQKHRCTSLRERSNLEVKFGLGAHVDTRRRLVEDEHSRFGGRRACL